MKLSSVSIDRSPKRVALILDASRSVGTEEWNLETELAISLLSQTLAGDHDSVVRHPDDQFLLLIVNANAPAEGFRSLTSVKELLQGLKESRPGAVGSDDRVYDALFAAAKKLDPPKFGDTLFFFGRVEDSGSAVAPDELRKLILKDRLRLYALSFSDPLRKMPLGWDPNKPLPSTFVRPKLDEMSSETGYPVSYHQLVVFHKFKDQLPLLKNFLAMLYDEIAEPYRMSFETPGIQGSSKLEIMLVGTSAEGIRPGGIHYQRTLFPCVAQQ